MKRSRWIPNVETIKSCFLHQQQANETFYKFTQFSRGLTV